MSFPSHYEKSLRLFSQRGVLELGRHVLRVERASTWLQHILSIQEAIYRIDDYFEGNKELSYHALKRMWNDVETAISEADVAPIEHCWASFCRLRLYESAEKRIHDGHLIDPREYQQIVSLKVSDVAIARSLIWSYAGYSPSDQDYRFWYLLDECGELLEDLQDLSEDVASLNFNFWLYSHMAGGSLISGALSAEDTLRQKLHQLELAYRRLSGESVRASKPTFLRMMKAGQRTLDVEWPARLISIRSRLQRYSQVLVCP